MSTRILGLAIGLVMLIPVAGISLYALGAYERFSRFTESIAGISGPGATPADSGPPEPLGSMGLSFLEMIEGHRDRRKADAIFDPDTPTRHRRVTWNVHLPVDDVLRPGEPRPEPMMEPLYILARAPALAMDLCADMLADMAKGCGFARAEVDADRSGMHKLELRVGFLPADPVGDTTDLATATLETEIVPLDDPDTFGRRVAPEARAALREDYRQRARDYCDALRQRVGSCVITSIRVNETPVPDGDGTWYVNATATFAWLKSDPAAEADLAALDSESSGLAGLLNSITGGGAVAAGPAEDSAPVVLNGGGAFKNASGNSRFQKVGE
ncbi:hypothetical protein [Psychromarinibacter halotolerans]|uniref:Uncharacterized protein n=1 Tax=Psychromarinibacter halotolerans TaxID=1775175 RepID=A0ABV7GMB9_9RHOB|nr:hypothetical protein [Psychromarinibacter halotolerans]MDF0595719.1 hypothetical protein [Psychromarinibacter halotolerans]